MVCGGGGGGLKRINQILIILFGFSHSLLFVSISVFSSRKMTPAHTQEQWKGQEYEPFSLHLPNAPEMSAQWLRALMCGI